MRLVREAGYFYGLVDGRRRVDGAVADEVWRQLHDDAGKADPKYFGFTGAKSRFLVFFPNDFHADGSSSQERGYRVEAKRKLDATAPSAEAMYSRGSGKAVLSAFQMTNMQSRFEKAKVADVLCCRDADALVKAVA
ncbi:MAG: hypothetical protein OXI87_09450 [Albidovulum sp.]|nr:hypothetical protein [Albidovulum sp.]